MKANHHTHTWFSDGSSHPEEYIIQAIDRGFDIIGFTEHSPLPFNNPFSFKAERREEYLTLFSELKEKYAGQVKVYMGMEMDYIPGMSEDFTTFRKSYRLDYLIGSVHLVRAGLDDDLWFTDGPLSATYDQGVNELFSGDIRKAVTSYYRQVNEMITTQQFEIIGHFDKIKMHNKGRFFDESEGWYQDLVKETIRLIREKGLIVEVNTRGLYKKRSDSTFPGFEILAILQSMKIPVMVNSDAHQPHELEEGFSNAFDLLKRAGYCETYHYADGQWYSTVIDKIENQ